MKSYEKEEIVEMAAKQSTLTSVRYTEQYFAICCSLSPF